MAWPGCPGELGEAECCSLPSEGGFSSLLLTIGAWSCCALIPRARPCRGSHFQGREGREWLCTGRTGQAHITPGSGHGQVPPVQSDLSLWQALREDLWGEDGWSCSWVTQPIIQLEDAAASLTAKIMDIQMLRV